jgi:serine protease Do
MFLKSRHTIYWTALALLALPAAGLAQSAPEWEGLLRMAGVESQSYLGVGVQEVNGERAKALRLKEEYGVEITRVEDDSPASRAGLQVKDVVLEYNGQRVEGTEQFIRLVRETPANRTVRMLVFRNGSTTTVPAAIGTRKPMVISALPLENWKVRAPDFEVVMPDIPKARMSWRSSMLGVEAESLGDSQLGDFFGVKEGVLVRSVMKSSSADKAGIKAGDVIVKVEESKVATPRDVTAALRSAKSEGKKSLSAVIMRDRKESVLTVSLDEEPGMPPPPKAPSVGFKQMKL